jgi:hypothetical protein
MLALKIVKKIGAGSYFVPIFWLRTAHTAFNCNFTRLTANSCRSAAQRTVVAFAAGK